MIKMIKEYNGMVTDSSLMDFAAKELNLYFLGELFKTRDVVLKHFNLSNYDEVDQTAIILTIFQMVTDYQLEYGFEDLSISEVFSDNGFLEVVDEYIDTFEIFV